MADPATFLRVFPEFTSMGADQLEFWLSQASLQLALGRLGANADLAVYLYTAHNLVLSKQETIDASKGKLPGGTLGPIASKTVGSVSVTYDSGSIATQAAGVYNATSYGQRLWKLLQSASLGGVYAAIPSRPHVYTYLGPGGPQ